MLLLLYKRMTTTCSPLITRNLDDIITEASFVKKWKYSSFQSTAVTKELETVASLLETQEQN